MKKLSYLIVIVLIYSLVLTGCSLLSNVGQVPASEQSGVTYLTRSTESDPMQIDLLAGQTEDIGDVFVWNDTDTLYVKFVYDGPDCGFLEVHLQVDEGQFSPDILTKKGNPIPGKFEKSYDVGCFIEHTFTYDLAAEGFECDDDLVIAAHAALGREDTMTFESNVGDTVYGPINSDNGPTDWGVSGLAVRAYNWLGYTRDLSDPDQIPGCGTNPYSSLTWSWGFDLNLTYSPDIPGVLWISTAPNTEEWHVDSWRKFIENYEVPGFPISGSLQVNADNYYVVSNGETIGSDANIFNGPETYTFYPVEGMNTLEFITENWAQGSEVNYCDQLANPNGITYKGTVSYYADGETAWGCGNDSVEPNCYEFDGKNWATYFSYTVGCAKCPSITASSGINVLDMPLENVSPCMTISDMPQIFPEYSGSNHGGFKLDIVGDQAQIPGTPIAAGTPVCSYYVHFDKCGASKVAVGYITFSKPVIGLIVAGTYNPSDIFYKEGIYTMYDVNTKFGEEIKYPVKGDASGLEIFYKDLPDSKSQDNVWVVGNTVYFELSIYDKHDSFRIIVSPEY